MEYIVFPHRVFTAFISQEYVLVIILIMSILSNIRAIPRRARLHSQQTGSQLSCIRGFYIHKVRGGSRGSPATYFAPPLDISEPLQVGIMPNLVHPPPSLHPLQTYSRQLLTHH